MRTKRPNLRASIISDARAIGLTGILAVIVFSLSLVAGGGGAEAPFVKGLLAACGATLIATALTEHFAGRRTLHPTAWGILAFFVMALALCFYQMTPFADPSWSEEGLRSLDSELLLAVGMSDIPRSVSLDPEATRRAMTAFFLPTGLALAGLGASRKELRIWLWTFAAIALLHATIGLLQLILAGPDWLQFFRNRTSTAASGLFANSNHYATFMMLGVLGASALIVTAPHRTDIRDSPRPLDNSPWLLIFFFAVAAVGSGSRAGIMLGLFAVPAAVIFGLPWKNVVKSFGVLLVLPLIAVAYLAAYPSSYQAAFRQDLTGAQDLRFSLLPDLVYLLNGYWPTGSGLGSFVPIFAAQENLDNVFVAYINHAHNDWLEWLIETGLVGAILLGSFLLSILIVAALTLFRGRKERGAGNRLVVLGGAMLVTVAIHSAFDYPVRMPAIAAVMALALVLVAGRWTGGKANQDAQGATDLSKLRQWSSAVAGSLAAIIGGLSLAPPMLAQEYVREGSVSRALALRPNHPQAAARVASRLAQNERNDEAQALALRAIRANPINPTAFRVLASVVQSKDQDASALWVGAMKLGWRDPEVQLFAFQNAVQSQQFGIAALRADAYMRTTLGRSMNPDFLSAVRIAGNHDEFRGAFVNRLALSPNWRRELFRVRENVREGELEGLAQIVAAAEESDLPVSLVEVAPFLRGLVSAGQHRVASQIDRLVRFRGETGTAYLQSDFEDEIAGRALSPFQWNTHNSNSVMTSLEGTDNRYIYVESRGREVYPALSRLAVLPAGKWEITYKEWSTDSALSPVRPIVRCVNGNILSQGDFATLTARRTDHSHTFDVPVSCETVALQFGADLDGQKRISFLDDIRLRRIAR